MSGLLGHMRSRVYIRKSLQVPSFAIPTMCFCRTVQMRTSPIFSSLLRRRWSVSSARGTGLIAPSHAETRFGAHDRCEWRQGCGGKLPNAVGPNGVPQGPDSNLQGARHATSDIIAFRFVSDSGTARLPRPGAEGGNHIRRERGAGIQHRHQQGSRSTSIDLMPWPELRLRTTRYSQRLNSRTPSPNQE